MSDFVIATRYANSLMMISEEKDTLNITIEEVSLIKNTMEASRELRVFLDNPVIHSEMKGRVLKELFDTRVSSDLTNFLQFLVKKGRENLLLEISKRFLFLSNQKLNRVDVDIVSAIELDDKQKEEIKIKLEKMVNKTITPSFKVDTSIIGGFKARFSDTVVDASVKHQLELLRKKLFQEEYLRN
jgi:F-type H+-transporting ATPase subunit delta